MVAWFQGGGGSAYFRGDVDEKKYADGSENLTWTMNQDFASGASVGTNGHVDVAAGKWQVDVIGYAYPDDGASTAGYVRPRICALTSVGGVDDVTFADRYDWLTPDGVVRADFAFSGIVDVPSGGSLTVGVYHNNTGSQVWVAWQMSAHFVGT